MPIFPQSRYTQGTLTRLPNSGGTYNLTVLRTVAGQNVPFSWYIWQNRDRVDVVANRFLGNPHLWWAIFDINPEIIYPLNIPAGTPVRIPSAPVAGQGTTLQ